jgi:GTP:adenosylcobinamide-phosphate guanylyltransferase
MLRRWKFLKTLKWKAKFFAVEHCCRVALFWNEHHKKPKVSIEKSISSFNETSTSFYKTDFTSCLISKVQSLLIIVADLTYALDLGNDELKVKQNVSQEVVMYAFPLIALLLS